MLEVGQDYIHLPTSRPVKVAEVTETGFTVHTLDDIWIHPKTCKLSGGCAWSMTKDYESKFVRVD